MDNVSAQAPAVEATPQAAPASTTEQHKPEPTPQFDETALRKLAREEATRIAQSLVDKGESRITKQIQDRLAALEMTRGDLGLTDEDVERARQKIITNVMTAKPEPAPASAPAPSEVSEVNPVYAKTLQVFEEEGVTVEEGDPEFKEIMDAWNDPKGSETKYLKAVYRAVSAKQQRTASQQEHAAARVSAPGTNAPVLGKPLTIEEKLSKGLRGPK
jgi:hypothetical protein